MRILVLCLCASLWTVPALGLVYDPAGYPHWRRELPSGLDYLESGLYWMQDWSGAENPRDPATIIALMEDQFARYFDLGYMAYRVAGPHYAAQDVLARSHFQNRMRDRLFTLLARRMGWMGGRMPRFRPLLPYRSGSNEITVGGWFHHFTGPRVRLEFRLYLSGRGWRVFDVRSNGRSLVLQLRRDFLRGAL